MNNERVVSYVSYLLSFTTWANKLQDIKAKVFRYHTYALPHICRDIKKTHMLIIKGLHSEPAPEDVKEELLERDVVVKRVLILNSKGTDSNPPTYKVITSNRHRLRELQHKIKSVYNTKIHWEEYRRRNKLPQCHRCQQWGHTAAYCSKDFKCLWCAGPHKGSECHDKTQRKCANCGEKHAASTTECREYSNMLNSRIRGRTGTTEPKTDHQEGSRPQQKTTSLPCRLQEAPGLRQPPQSLHSSRPLPIQPPRSVWIRPPTTNAAPTPHNAPKDSYSARLNSAYSEEQVPRPQLSAPHTTSK